MLHALTTAHNRSVNGPRLDNHGHNQTAAITVLSIILHNLGNFIDFSFYFNIQPER